MRFLISRMRARVRCHARRQCFSIDHQSSSERQSASCTLGRNNENKREETFVDHCGVKFAEYVALFIALNVRAIHQVE
jgi:hypothetical protein